MQQDLTLISMYLYQGLDLVGSIGNKGSLLNLMNCMQWIKLDLMKSDNYTCGFYRILSHNRLGCDRVLFLNKLMAKTIQIDI